MTTFSPSCTIGLSNKIFPSPNIPGSSVVVVVVVVVDDEVVDIVVVFMSEVLVCKVVSWRLCGMSFPKKIPIVDFFVVLSVELVVDILKSLDDVVGNSSVVARSSVRLPNCIMGCIDVVSS